MSKIIVFDTETTGLMPDENVILQLSYQIVDSSTWNVEKTVNHYFDWPEEEWRVQYGAIAVNGLTKEFLSQQKISNRRRAIREFMADLEKCDAAVGHNVQFDVQFMEAEARREGVDYTLYEWPTFYDTMKSTVELCKLPRRNGGEGYKYPRLSELAEFLCIDLSDLRLHDSSADVELTYRCFRKLCDMGHFDFE